MTTDDPGGPAIEPHARSAAEVSRELGVEPSRGLPAMEVRRRSAAAGPNELDAPARTSAWTLVASAVSEPFMLLLIVAGVLAILLGETRDGILILLALIPILAADVVTEYRGERALEALRDASAPVARVRRDGRVLEAAAAGLVPGDVVLLRSGDIVPADLRIVTAEGLLVDRSLLTGESVPEPAVAESDPPAAGLADRRSLAYGGTCVVAGRAEGVVVAIGAATEVGRIAGRLGPLERRRSLLQAELDRLVRILLVLAVALIVIVTGLGFVRGQAAGDNLLAGISAAIAAIPEEPPVLLAVILGLGAYRLLRRGVLVRRLSAQETLGSIDLIITDKTGTLTRNRLEVASISDAAGPVEAGLRPAILAEALRAEDDAWVTADGAAPGSFTASLVRAIEADGGDAGLDPDRLLVAEPFATGRPLSRTRSRTDDGVVELIIGAPEIILDIVAPPSGERSAWIGRIEACTARGERLVGLARRLDDGDWQMRALIGFADPLRDGIREAFATARAAGVAVIVVTGDHPITAQAVAGEAGLAAGRVIVGEELAAWGDQRLASELADLEIVARSTPDQKERLVRIARGAGRTVAVTGDGVNDAPALHRADVAVAMGSGTGVAREAADLVLGDDSFATLMYGLAEGRRIVDNIQKGLIFVISTHVALLGFILIATLAGYGQPLLPLQILWLELFIDVSTSVAFELEKPEPDVMRRPPRRRGIPLLTRAILARIGVAGGFSAVAALAVMVSHPGPPEHARWLAFTTLVCAQAVRAYANRSIREPVHRLEPNRFLLSAGLLVVAIQVAIPCVPILAEAFQAAPLDAGEWILVAAIAIGPAILAEVVRTVTDRAWIA